MTGGYFAGDSIWTPIATIGGLLSLIGGAFVYWKNGTRAHKIAEQERLEKRSAYLERLLEAFSKNRVRELVDLSDDANEMDRFFREMDKRFENDPMERNENREALEEALRFMEWVLYLENNKQISTEEFGFFANEFKQIASDAHVRGYVCDPNKSYCSTEWSSKRWPRLREFIESLKVEDAVNSNGSSNVESSDSTTAPNAASNELSAVDFDEPTMIIKINQKYREGMSDAEIFQAVHGFWLVRPEKASRYQVVLAVAFGIVRGVYLSAGWRRMTDGPRSFFEKAIDKEKETRLRARYMGKNVKTMFSQGVANPIRYVEPADGDDANEKASAE